MPRIFASESATIDAPADRVYGLIADFHNGHPLIVPPKYFSDMEVLRGGVGAGTIVRFKMHVMGMTRTMRAEVTEPEPGRLLVEAYPDSGEVTTFTVEPVESGRCSVKITTEWKRGGLGGLIQRLLVPGMLRKVFREELRLIGTVAAQASE
jgi:hypothetical protein